MTRFADRKLLNDAATRANRYLEDLGGRSVAPAASAVAALEQLGGSLPEEGMAASKVLALLDDSGSAATVASAGGRYFGFVTGGVLPAALATGWLASAWDQNTFSTVSSPVGAAIEAIALDWVGDVLGLPRDCAGAFVTGATMANFTALAAARHAVLARAGWDAEADGLFAAPPVTVLVGEEVHATLFKIIGLLGLGRERVVRVPVDDQGRMRADAMPELSGPAIVCAQAGNVNSGAFDPIAAICERAHGAGAWVHVDGAFGLWAAAAPGYAGLVDGVEAADSWATDAHKWLNVTYDNGIAFVRRASALRHTFAAVAGYLPPDEGFEAMHHTPQSSQRARQIEVWAVLRTLGRSGVAELVQQASAAAVVIADRLRAAGLEILNDVVLNQVLVRLDDDETTEALISEVQHDGRIWCGPTSWDSGTAMRISVSSWKTTVADAATAADVIVECAGRLDT